MKRTNSKEVRQAIRERLADYCENDYETFEANAKAICNPREDYLVIGARKLAEAGEFIIAYVDARAFLEDVLEQDTDESRKYSNDQVWKLYCYLIGAEGSKILRNGGWAK